MLICRYALLLGLSVAWPAFGQNITVEKATIPLAEVPRTITAETFDPDFPVGDSNYHALEPISDGTLHFVVNTHDLDYGCRYYIFDPITGTITEAPNIDRSLREPAGTHVPQGKVHTPLFEHEGAVYFATHIAFYEGGLPGRDAGDRVPYSGGRFMKYDLKTKKFVELAKVMPSEGIITLTIDKANEVLYGLTWPSGILVSYDLETEALKTWGAVQGRGEWGAHPHNWDRICRTLGVAPGGKVYGSTMHGRIWEFVPGELNPVTYLEGLDLSRVPRSQSAAETLRGDFQQNWRILDWNPKTDSFWGILWETTALFEFRPEERYVRAVTELRPNEYQDMPRNPEISQLGFMLGPDQTIYYLAHGPAVDVPNRPAVQSGLYLLTYNMATGEQINHGPIFTEGDRRVFFTESIALGSDDKLYTVAWVEVTDPKRRAEIQTARKQGPEETESMVYEMLLVRFPRPADH
jgi:hypothetical protein